LDRCQIECKHFLLTIKSRTNPKSKATEEFAHIGGAYVSCYIAFKDFVGAEKLAKLLIREEGWIPEKRFEAWKIEKETMICLASLAMILDGESPENQISIQNDPNSNDISNMQILVWS